MTQHILVTGVAGFIGSKVAEFLLKAGYRVTGLDNLNAAYAARLKQWRLEQLNPYPAFSFYQVDITDYEALGSVLRGNSWNAVVNLAAWAGVRRSTETPRIYYETNVLGTLNLLTLCKELAIPKFVLASSSSLYGAQTVQPFREEQTTDYPLSPYAASKKAAEVLCYTYHHLYGIDVSVLRYFTVYGPAQRPDMALFRFVQWISEGLPVTVYGDGQQLRDFTYVDDIARGTIAALRPLGYEIINLGSDRPLMLRHVIQQIEVLVGHPAHLIWQPRHEADVESTWADISKARRLLDWEPETPFEQGLENLVTWYRTHREWAKDIPTG